jgi:RNA polymerase sigma-70 factor (ECF subfamily)
MQKGGNIPVANNEFTTNQMMESDDDLLKKLEEKHLFPQLEQSIQDLPSAQRTCIELFYIRRMTYAAIAAETKYSIKDVKANLQKGIADLKNKMEALVDVAK